MTQRENGLPGTTKNVTYRLNCIGMETFTKELTDLIINLVQDEYYLVDCHKVKSNSTFEYIVDFHSKKEGLK